MHRAAEMHGDIIPISELLGDASITRRVIFFEIVERRVGKHHTATEGIVGAVALIHSDIGLRPLFPEQDRRIEPSGPTTDDRDFHDGPPAQLRDRNYFKPKIISLTSPRCGHSFD